MAMQADFTDINAMKRKYEADGYLWNDAHIMPEHRAIAYLTLGRVLQECEHVHHINEDKQDNRPENLIVLHINVHKLLTIYMKWIGKRWYSTWMPEFGCTWTKLNEPEGLMTMLTDAGIPFIWLGDKEHSLAVSSKSNKRKGVKKNANTT